MIDPLVLEEKVQSLYSSHRGEEERGEVNCMSAAFFLLGLSDAERYIDPSDRAVYATVERSTPVSDLKEAGFIVVRGVQISSSRGMGMTRISFTDGTKPIQHLAVVRHRELGILCDRPKFNAFFRPSVPFTEFQREFRALEHQKMYSHITFEFYQL
ncbi:MAG: hypothetical protein AABX37_04505 [Nanoarchaeota archaeon]